MSRAAAPVRCLTVGAGTAWEAAFVAACDEPAAPVEVVGRCVELGDLLAVLRLDPPEAVVCDAAVVWLDSDAVAAIDAAGSAAVAVADSDSDRPRRLGFVHVVTAAEPARLLDSVVEAARPLPAPTTGGVDAGAGSGGASLLVVVWGPKGGTGRTTLAVNLAWELALDGARCVLVDADTYGGSVALALDLPERPNVAALAREVARGDVPPHVLPARLPRPVPGLYVVPGLARAQAWPDLRGGDLHVLLAALRTQAQVVVVDVGACLEDDAELLLSASPWRRNQAALAALAAADRVYAVVAADPASVRHALLSASDLAVATGSRACVHTVASRPRDEATGRQVLGEVARVCGWTGGALLPQDAAAPQALWAGRSLAEVASRSRLRRAIRDLSRSLGSDWASGRLVARAEAEVGEEVLR